MGYFERCVSEQLLLLLCYIAVVNMLCLLNFICFFFIYSYDEYFPHTAMTILSFGRNRTEPAKAMARCRLLGDLSAWYAGRKDNVR